jgi:hypothetical protein
MPAPPYPRFPTEPARVPSDPEPRFSPERHPPVQPNRRDDAGAPRIRRTVTRRIKVSSTETPKIRMIQSDLFPVPLGNDW